jgi:hypothetical protein
VNINKTACLSFGDLLAIARCSSSAIKVSSERAPEEHSMTGRNIMLYKRLQPVKHLEISIKGTII